MKLSDVEWGEDYNITPIVCRKGSTIAENLHTDTIEFVGEVDNPENYSVVNRELVQPEDLNATIYANCSFRAVEPELVVIVKKIK